VISYPGLVRQLVNEALAEDEIRDLCFDYFREVSNKLSAAMGRGECIRQLVDWCYRQKQMDALLARVKQANSSVYKDYIPHLEKFKDTFPPDPHTPLTQLGLELSDLIDQMPMLMDELLSILQSFGQDIYLRDCTKANTYLTDVANPLYEFNSFLENSGELPPKVIPKRYELLTALKDFNRQSNILGKSISQYCTKFGLVANQPIEEREKIQRQLGSLIQCHQAVLVEARTLRDIIDGERTS
jgi:hypothetical protein